MVSGATQRRAPLTRHPLTPESVTSDGGDKWCARPALYSLLCPETATCATRDPTGTEVASCNLRGAALPSSAAVGERSRPPLPPPPTPNLAFPARDRRSRACPAP